MCCLVICTGWFRASGADHFSSSIFKACVRKQAESPFESTESRAVFFTCLIIKRQLFQRKHPEYGFFFFFSGTPLQKEAQNVVIVSQREGLLPLSSHCMKPAPFDVFPPYRKDTDKGFFVCGQQPGRKNLQIIWPYRKGVNREKREEEEDREEGEREDMRQTERGGKRWWSKKKKKDRKNLKSKEDIKENQRRWRRQRSKQKERRKEGWGKEKGERGGGRGREVAG